MIGNRKFLLAGAQLTRCGADLEARDEAGVSPHAAPAKLAPPVTNSVIPASCLSVSPHRLALSLQHLSLTASALHIERGGGRRACSPEAGRLQRGT